MASIDGPMMKFDRGKEHLEALRRSLSPLENIDSYTITRDIDKETGQQIRRFDSVPAVPVGLEILFGEMLYNFRSALDHIIWQLVLSEGQIPNNYNEFPIYNDFDKYESKKRGKLRGVSTSVRSIIDGLQPCNSTPPTDYWWYLWYLQELSNADKHRHLLLTRRSLGQRLTLVSFSGGSRIKGRYLDVPVETGSIFFRGEPNVDVDVLPRIAVHFSNAPSSIRKDLPVGNIADLIELFQRLPSHIR